MTGKPITKWRVSTGDFAAYRRAETAEDAKKLIYFRLKVTMKIRGRRYRDVTAGWTVEPAARQPRRG
jgi:hypothetical protein